MEEDRAKGLEETVKVTWATFAPRFAGGIEAETISDTVMTYRDDGTPDFVGFQRVVGRIGQRSESAAAALSAMDQFLHEPPIELLARVLGLTHSGTVRLVDRLEHDGYVRRRPGRDGRSTAVSLTASGWRAAARVAAAGAHVLDDALEVLSPAERRDARAGRDPVDVPPVRPARLRPRHRRLSGRPRGAGALPRSRLE